jgi:guanylate kinase
MNNKIIVICGFAGSGKDTICKYISDNYDYKMIISTSSRPIRPNESEGNPYHFVSRETFEKMIEYGECIECRKYNTLVNNVPDIWYYGVHKNSIDLSKNNYVVVLDMLGLIEIKKYFKDNIISFFIDVNEPERRRRAFQSRKNFDLTEWNRRFIDDSKQFPLDRIVDEVNFIVENYDFDKCIDTIVRVIERKINESKNM